MIDTKNELRLAQKALVKGNIGDAYMRLMDTPFEKDMISIYERVRLLNDKLINAIR